MEESVEEVRDLIVIEVFCEVYGPSPLLTLTSASSKLNNNKGFNVDEFLLYVMTTDYQNFPG